MQTQNNLKDKCLNKHSKGEKELDFMARVEEVKYIDINNERCSRSLNKTNLNIDKHKLSASES